MTISSTKQTKKEYVWYDDEGEELIVSKHSWSYVLGHIFQNKVSGVKNVEVEVDPEDGRSCRILRDNDFILEYLGEL